MVTSDLGTFRLEGVPLGIQALVLRHLAYGEHEHSLALEESSAHHL